MNQKKIDYILNVVLFSVLLITPLFIFYFRLSMLSEEGKQKLFLIEKVNSSFKDFETKNPETIEVIFPDDYTGLSFAKDLEPGDYIFINKNNTLAVFVDRETEVIHGYSLFPK